MDIEKHVSQVLKEAAAFEPKIGDQETYVAAGKALKQVTAAIKTVEEHYAEDKKRSYEIYKAVLDDIKTLSDPLSTSKSKIKKAMDAYSADQKRRAIEAAEKAAAEQPDQAPLDLVVEKPVIAGVTEVTYWQWELVDKSKLPLEFLMVDEKKIGALVRDMKDSAQGIVGDGIRVYSETRTRG